MKKYANLDSKDEKRISIPNDIIKIIANYFTKKENFNYQENNLTKPIKLTNQSTMQENTKENKENQDFYKNNPSPSPSNAASVKKDEKKNQCCNIM